MRPSVPIPPPGREGCFMMDTAVIKFYVSAAVYFYWESEQMSGEFEASD